MSSEKTEKATPKRLEKARSEGQVSKSQDFNAGITLLASVYAIQIYAPLILQKTKEITINTLSNLDPSQVNNESVLGFLTEYINEVVIILMPIMGIMMSAGIASNLYQVGPLLSYKAIKPDIAKLSPDKLLMNFKKFFGAKTYVELLKSLIKTGIVSGIGYAVIEKNRAELTALLGGDLNYAFALISKIIFDMMLQITIALIVLGIFDKKYQDWEFQKSMKMTKQEIKDERKNVEGDPKIKAKVRSIQMKFAMQRMISALPSADVVVTNPIHYAVALRYDTSKAPAPQVIAKGVDYVAFRIKEIAEANKIPIMENPPLARTIYKIVPLDGLIPAELYVAVAEVLAFVYKTNRKKKS
jgi:flagellar biosynthetic protein FlhB